MKISIEYKKKVAESILSQRENYGGSAKDYAMSLGIKPAIYSRIKSGEIDKVLSDGVWLTIGRKLKVDIKTVKWKVVRTKVYEQMESLMLFAQQYKVSFMWVDQSGIGKTECSQDLVLRMKNAFYVDCSQCKEKRELIYSIARTVGVDTMGTYREVKANLKYFLTIIDPAVIVLDEYGDLTHAAYLEHKEIMNATSGNVGWIALGADGLKTKMEGGVNRKTIGYREIWGRFQENFITITPTIPMDKIAFYSELFTDIATANMGNKNHVNEVVQKALARIKPSKYEKTETKNRKDQDLLRVTSGRYLRILIEIKQSES